MRGRVTIIRQLYRIAEILTYYLLQYTGAGLGGV